MRLIAAGNTGGQADKIQLGLQFQMLPGWKIYWRSPGDAGFPPRPSWAGSKNVAAVQVNWPTPVRFSVTGLETLGYKNEVVLPLEMEPFEPGKPVSIRAQVPYLTCAEICVPYDARLSLDLPAGPESNSPESALIERFAALVPTKGAGDSLSVAVAEVDGAPGKQQLRIVASAAQPFTKPDLLIEGPAGFRFGKPRVQKLEANGSAGRAVLLASVSPPPKSVRSGSPTDLVGANLVLTMIDGSRAVEQQFKVRQGQPALDQVAAPTTVPALPPVSLAAFLGILGLALIGGLILNLMPCVLPILSLKLLSVVGHGGGDRRDVRRGFLASAAGIVVSFLALGTVAVALKAGGQAAGWGIQFQHPLFLTATAVIVTLFAANLWGLFEIRLPGGVADAALTVGQDSRHGLTKHFLTGAFATLLATPCSAPFLGTAVGFALARGPFEIYAIFTMLGIGLALPYLVIAWLPWLATRLPRPGPWIVTLRRIMGLALAATAIWLLSVLDTQAGRTAAMLGGGLIGGLLAVLWVGRMAVNSSPKVIGGAATIIAVLGILLPPQFAHEGLLDREIAQGAIRWQKFAPEAIAGHVAAGRTVFVDVTADWCVTCIVNKALVLDQADVAARLNDNGIIAMQADWTRPDPKITVFLQRFMRYGIPFNVVFGPKAPQGRTLPELLTRDAVFSALEAAAPRAVAGK
ncbi:MAG: protein-disulfide reductase DsbD family protein [Proteobacteria bacterium]|nr:protein-disulfide reductase DsbD family protein [Pseudomonadota bacterium]